MKLLMFNVREFWYKTYEKTLKEVIDTDEEESVKDAIVVFANVEREDQEQTVSTIRKAVKNILWLARKTGRSRIVLHSFAHLSDSKSSVEYAAQIFEAIEDRLTQKGYEVSSTPFGYFLEFKIHVLGESLAKVWKALN
ncbi:MAG: threonyl-tRNA synthetase editing domain-containing protein [Candidatus Bathyarchaeota archaeon]|nr:threonyl-tRNA synthetase editing domain-containing protein [Candidatus Bathyarchaeota archaeon]